MNAVSVRFMFLAKCTLDEERVLDITHIKDIRFLCSVSTCKRIVASSTEIVICSKGIVSCGKRIISIRDGVRAEGVEVCHFACLNGGIFV